MINIYNTIQDISKELHIEFNTVLKLLKNKFINNIYINTTLNEFIDYEYYEDIIIKFNELGYDIKESLSEFLNFDQKYKRSIYLELCNLNSCQIDKVTKSFKILSENDLEIVLNEIIKTMNSNFEKIPPDTKYKFLCCIKVEINIFEYQAFKKHVRPVKSCTYMSKPRTRRWQTNSLTMMSP